MNTRINKTVLLIILMICLATAVYSAVGTFTFRTSGASDTIEVVDLRYPQKVPEDASVTTDSIADGSVTNDKLAEPVSVANGGTGKTTAAEALAALGGANLNGSNIVAENFIKNVILGNIRYPAGPVVHWSAKGLTTAGIAVASGVRDLSGFGYNGDQTNGVTVEASPVGPAFGFVQASHQYLSASVVSPGVTSWALWVKASKDGTEQRFISQDIDGVYDRRLEISSNNAIYFVTRLSNGTTAVQTILPDSQWSGDTWMHLVAVADTDRDYIYKDGVLITSTAKASTYSTYGNKHRIGTTVAATTRYLNGQIADPRIYGHALSAAEVKALYLAGADGGPVYMQTNGRNASGIPEYADNATAAAAGLPVGAMYHTTGALKVVVP